MTATAPTSNPSPSVSAQSLRQRYSRLSPLRLGVYVLVSLGSHLLLLGLFRWAWQVQLATQPVGSPVGIDFVEVDLSDGSFAGQLPNESADESADGELAGGKLSAAQLNELIAQGDSASVDAIAEADEPNPSEPGQSELGQSEAFSDGVASETASTTNPPPASASETEPPRSWFPRPPLLPSPSDNATDQGDRDSSNPSANNREPSETTEPDGAEAAPGGSNGETTAPGSDNDGAQTASEEPQGGEPPAEEIEPGTAGGIAGEAGNSANADNVPASPTGAAEGQNSNSDGGNASVSSGSPNDLPTNMNEQPVDPDQTVQPGETASESVDSESNVPGPGNSPGAENRPENAGPGEGEADNPVPRLGAKLVVDEDRSRAFNTQDVSTQLPRPLGDPLSSGSQSASGGRCQSQLAALTPASYGQPVQLKLAVDIYGEVFEVEGVGAQAQTAVGQAIACIAREWPFEPAKRVIEEGGVEKVENTGAVLFVTVTISLLE